VNFSLTRQCRVRRQRRENAGPDELHARHGHYTHGRIGLLVSVQRLVGRRGRHEQSTARHVDDDLFITANFVPPVADLIVDNPQATLTGSWTAATTATG